MIKRIAKSIVAAAGPVLPLLGAALVGDIIGTWAVILISAAFIGWLTWRVPNEAE